MGRELAFSQSTVYSTGPEGRARKQVAVSKAASVSVNELCSLVAKSDEVELNQPVGFSSDKEPSDLSLKVALIDTTEGGSITIGALVSVTEEEREPVLVKKVSEVASAKSCSRRARDPSLRVSWDIKPSMEPEQCPKTQTKPSPLDTDSNTFGS